VKYLALAYLTIVLVASLCAFVAYGWDKRQASKGGRRIAERRLHQLALWGGWPGAWFGQQVFRHKTQKSSFLIWFWLTVLLHGLLIVTAVTLWIRQA